MKQLILTTPLELIASALALAHNNTGGGDDITLDEADLLLHALFDGSTSDAAFAQSYTELRDTFQRIKGASEVAARFGAPSAIFDTQTGEFLVAGQNTLADELKAVYGTLKEAQDELAAARLQAGISESRARSFENECNRLRRANEILRGAGGVAEAIQKDRAAAKAESAANDADEVNGKAPTGVPKDEAEGVAEAILSALREMGHTGPVEIRRIVI